MPIYEYECMAGHVTTRLRCHDQADDPVECDACEIPEGEVARPAAVRVISATKTNFRHADRKAFKS